MTFDEVMGKGRWTAIRDCPGRYALRGVPPDLGLGGLLGEGPAPREFRSAKARDRVCVVPLEDGGLISYRREDGSWLHTLNTAEGFRRKLAQLEIDMDLPPVHHLIE